MPSDDLGLDLDATVYASDATTIDLCLSLFPWAKFRRAKGAVKLHTLLNLQGNIPEFILISDGKLHDVNVLDHLVPVPGAYYVMDRGYLDFERLYRTPSGQSVLRHPCQTQLQFPASLLARGRQNDRRSVRSNGCLGNLLLAARVSGAVASHSLLRCARDKRLVFLTNDFALPATTIAALYKSRWQIELFFKWIKQHLRIKVVLRHQRERRQVANLDRRVDLPARGDRQKGTRPRIAALHNSTDSERHRFSRKHL